MNVHSRFNDNVVILERFQLEYHKEPNHEKLTVWKTLKVILKKG